jgi:RND family efflux transporter MFP subunit
MRKYVLIATSVALVIGATVGAGVMYYLSYDGLLPSLHSDSETADHEDHDHESDEHAEHEEHGEHEEGVVHLSPEKLASLQLETRPVREGDLTTTIELPSEVQWNTDRLVHITPRAPGIVVEVRKSLGDIVQEDTLLCVLDSREMGNAKMEYLADLRRFEVARADFDREKTVYENTKKLLAILDGDPPPEEALEKAHDLAVGENKNRLLTAYTRMRVNQQNFQRMEKLLKDSIASEADWLEAKGDYEVSRADYSSTREEIVFDLELDYLRAQKDFDVARTEMRNSERALHILGMTGHETGQLKDQAEETDENISRTPLYSPITGVITDRHLTRGEMVGTNTPLYTIADMSDVWVIGRVYEREVRFLRVGQKATVRLDAFPGELFEGVVDYIGSQLDPDTRTVQARVVLPNPERRFRPGMFGVVTVFTPREGEATATASTSLLVPISALQRVEDGHVVYRVVEEGVFEAVPVQVAARSQDFAEVTGDLAADDRVVVGESFVLKSEMGRESLSSGGHAGHGH